MASAPSPRDLVEEWLVGWQAASRRSEAEMQALRQELERLDDRQLWRFLDWLGERRGRHWPGEPATGPSDATPRSAATALGRIAGFGLPRPHGGSPWSLRPRRMKRRRHGLSA